MKIEKILAAKEEEYGFTKDKKMKEREEKM